MSILDFKSNEIYYAGVTCADFPCKNNGTCVDTGKAFICACMSGEQKFKS